MSYQSSPLTLPAGSITEADVAELERLSAAYDEVVGLRHVGSTMGRRRKDLEAALVRFKADLIAAARARLPGNVMPPQERWAGKRASRG